MNHFRPFAVLALVLTLAACHSGGSGDAATPAPAPTPAPTSSPSPTPGATAQWYAGDLHVHDDHSSDGSAPRQCCDDQGPGNTGIADQVGFAQTLGLDFLPLTDHRTHDQHYDPAWESSALLLIRGEEANGRPHATVQGAVDTVVQGANPPDTPDFVNLQQSIWDAHAQGANWTTAHPDDGELEDDGVTPNIKANAVGVDLVEVWNRASNVEREMAYAEDRWNHGYRFGVAGASDDHFRELWAIAGPGMPTTRVFAAALTERGIVDGLRSGRTTLSGDPLAPTLTLEADFQNDDDYEAVGGDEAFVAAGTPGRLRLHVSNGAGATVLVYRSPGLSAGTFARFDVPLPMLEADFTVDITAEAEPTWYRAEVRGLGPVAGLDTGDVPLSLIPSPEDLPNQLRAATSPIFVSTAPVETQADVPVPADIGADDGADFVLGELQRYAGFPDLAVAVGVDHVVAEAHIDGASRIVYARRAGSDASTLDLTPQSTSARFPKVAARGADVWVAWQDEPAGEVPHRSVVLLRHSSDGGRSWGDAQPVRSLDGRAEHPALALTPEGQPVLAWQEIGSGKPFDVMVQIVGRDAEPVNLSGNGKTVAAPNPLDTRSARYPASVWPAIAVADDGRIAVAWQDDRTDIDPLWTGSALNGEGTDPDNWQILVRSRAAGADAWSDIAALGADDRADRHPSLAFAVDGALLAIWDTRELRSAGANVALLSAASTDGGTSWSEAQPVAYDADAMSQWPRLGRTASGDVRAVWYDTRSADWRQRVMTAVFGGDAWGGVSMLPSRGINTWPATAADRIVFASTRNAVRLQRDRSQQIFIAGAP